MKKCILLIVPFAITISIFAVDDSLEASKLQFEKRFAQLENKLFRRQIANAAVPTMLGALPFGLAAVGLCTATQKPMIGLGILAVSGATYGLKNVLKNARNLIAKLSLVRMIGDCELLSHDVQHHELSKKNTRWAENFMHQVKAIKLKCFAMIDSMHSTTGCDDTQCDGYIIIK